ncbi:hypothetical protein PR202_gb24051 [Eleusine coracana subsp. coracana]|uniref:F-box domain-containing protein n=1 Tax=Eleusine coracana subsp. coracana TaxID=191504 RepID=A0AAV5FK18_ELECO|nr:hypothetical protein PR202_gb24051 [Eleusine coracana subsp. coracana]
MGFFVRTAWPAPEGGLVFLTSSPIPDAFFISRLSSLMLTNRLCRRPDRSQTALAGETSMHRSRSIADLTDDLLELVLLSIRSPFCLIRAAAMCKLWRRMIAGTGFLRRFRSLHGPHVLGHYHYYVGDKTMFVPSPMPLGEGPDKISNRVSPDFIHRGHYLELSDSRGGLLAFVCSSGIAVCAPWSRQYYRVIDLPFTWTDR